MSILDKIASVPFGGIASGVASALEIAKVFAEKAKNQQQIDAGEAQAHVANLEAVNDQLATFKAAADRIDTDPAFRDSVRDYFTDDD